MESTIAKPTDDTELSQERKSKRLLATVLGGALLFFILGVGNLLIGMYKAHEYSTLLHQAKFEIVHERRPVIPLVDGSLNIDSQTKHIKRLQHRLDYYNLVSHGGTLFLAVAGLLLLCCVFIKSNNEEKRH